MTNKVDAATNVIFRYKYDANDRLTNRWTPAKTDTFYAFDRNGNLTNITYAVNPTNRMAYDALNRLTNMVDGVGTTTYSFDSGGLLKTEDGPWTSDTVTYSYQNRLRIGLNLQAPNASDWLQSYAYDGARRLASLTSPAGSFSYAYDSTRQMQVGRLSLPNGAYITNAYDSVSRLLSTVLKNSGNTILNSHGYGYNVGSQRTSVTNTLGDFRNYGYDNIGQLKTAIGKEPGGTTNRLQEQFGYAYDAAHNLNFRTNNALVQTFNVNSLNELTTGSRSGTFTVAGTTTSSATNVTVNTSNATRYADYTFAKDSFSLADGTNTFTAVAKDALARTDTSSVNAYLPASPSFTYDLNGNLLSDGRRAFDYDDENELIRVTVTNAFKSEFTYDGKMRRRMSREYTWQNSAWLSTNEVRYVYDGHLVLQERDGNNVPSVAYTRGQDLSGNLQDAGGIGGLLTFSQLSTLGPQHFFYQADGNGNVTILLNTLQLVVATYTYDPFGNPLSVSGPLAEANCYRYSSKEFRLGPGFVSYGYRDYEPNLQRWINRDPLDELGFDLLRLHNFRSEGLSSGEELWVVLNAYNFLGNTPANVFDPDGRFLFDPYCNLFFVTPAKKRSWDAYYDTLKRLHDKYGDLPLSIEEYMHNWRNELLRGFGEGVAPVIKTVPGTSIHPGQLGKPSRL